MGGHRHNHHPKGNKHNGKRSKNTKSPTKQVIDPQAAYVVSDILGDGQARAGLGGRDYTPKMNALGAKVAAKPAYRLTGQIGSKNRAKRHLDYRLHPPQHGCMVGQPRHNPAKGQGNHPSRQLWFFDETMAQVN